MAKKKNKKPWAPSKTKEAARMATNAATMDEVNALLFEASSSPVLPPVDLVDDVSMVLTVAEVCALLKISRRTLERSQVPGKVKIGGSVRYHRGLIEKWLIEQTKEASP